MSTTISQKRRNNQQESTETEGLVSPIVVENVCHLGQDESIASPSSAKSPTIESSFIESLRAFWKEERTSEIKNLLVESQKLLQNLLGQIQPKTTTRAQVVTVTSKTQIAWDERMKNE